MIYVVGPVKNKIRRKARVTLFIMLLAIFKKKRERRPRSKPKAALPLHYLVVAPCFTRIFLLHL